MKYCMRHILIVFWIYIPTCVLAFPYCATEDFFAIEKPGRVFSKGKKIDWIVFHFDRNNPKSSSWEIINAPYYYQFDKNEKLLSVLCAPKHLRFTIGSKKGLFQFIYEVSPMKIKLKHKEKLRTFFQNQLSELSARSPVKIKINNETHYKFEYGEKMKALGSQRFNTTRFLVAEAIVRGKQIRKWILWSTIFEETVD